MRLLLPLLAIASVLAGEQSLEWDDNSIHEDGFYIYRSIDGVNFTQIATTAKNVSKYTDKDVPVGHQVSYYVTAYNKWGESGPSNILTLGSEPPVPPTKLRKGSNDNE